VAQLKKLLVAYDGSTQSKEALDWAIDLSLLSGAQIIAVKVSEPLEVGQAYAMYEAGYGATLVDQLNDRETNDKQLLEEAIVLARQKGASITTDLLQGNIAATIIDYSKDKKVDMIIAGTKGHGVLEGLLMGSVTRNLVSLAHIPVLVVKD
jgi:nucleotide-binding universal stress UspA family protein